MKNGGNAPSPRSPSSLYIHIPFCAGACDYCDFYSVPITATEPYSADSPPARFVETLLSEAGRLFERCKPACVPTLYIGGGTPSVLGAAGISRLLRELSRIIGISSPPPMEITIEANPESADEAFLAAAREGGATRLSLGVQSFYGPSRRAVRRVGSQAPDETLLHSRIALAAAYFPGAFSGDLMSGLPFQDEKVLLDDISALLAYKPAHVSFYALTVEAETPLSNARPSFLPAPDEADRLWLCGRDTLEKSGYSQYEVSNFCKAGSESRHNIRYWLMQNWLALGPAASGTIIDDETGTGFRYTNPQDVDLWLSGKVNLFSASSRKGGESCEKLDSLTLIKETFLMGFRYIEGPDEELFQRRFRRGIDDFIPETLAAWRKRGLLQNGKIALTKEGFLFLDPFLACAFKELELSFSAC